LQRDDIGRNILRPDYLCLIELLAQLEKVLAIARGSVT
jgi:hypothetical protein